MSRPLLNADIAKLERLYFEGERDSTQLRQLEHELTFRTTSRAETLAGKVQTALRRLTSGELFPVVTPPPVEPPSLEPIQPAKPSREPPKHRTVDTSLSKEISEAYTALKLAPGAAWEDIEASRRSIVAQASPAVVTLVPHERAESLRTDAANANRAAALLGALAQKR